VVEELRTVSTPQGMIQYLLAVKKVKNMNLRVRPDGSVHVSVSRRVPKTAADDFVRSRANWIAARLAERAAGPGPLAPPDREAALPVLRASLERMWPLVEPLGVKKPELKARFMTSRWGSCHWTRGIIVLNTALTVVPQELLDYVTLHELVHFLHPNHGAGFYAAMDRLLPEWRVRRSALRSYTLAR